MYLKVTGQKDRDCPADLTFEARPSSHTTHPPETLTAEQTLLAAEVMLDLRTLRRPPPEIPVFAMKNLTTKQILHKPKRISVVSLPRVDCYILSCHFSVISGLRITTFGRMRQVKG